MTAYCSNNVLNVNIFLITDKLCTRATVTARLLIAAVAV